LDESRRFLVEDGIELVGAQTLDILIEAVPCPNEPVSKNDLLARVWLDVPVEEGSLPLHIDGLRKVLFGTKDGARYSPALKERCYCFVPSDRVEDIAAPARFPPVHLAAHLIGMVGRERTDDAYE
jgi:DNA-binding winged helix-turn-helix (wHTH) protein